MSDVRYHTPVSAATGRDRFVVGAVCPRGMPVASSTAPNHEEPMSHNRSNRQQHDPSEIAKHDDVGKDRLFEGREQHDEADKNSEKNRLARDVDRHGHEMDEQEGDSGSPYAG